jgi:hypothetical protein
MSASLVRSLLSGLLPSGKVTITSEPGIKAPVIPGLPTFECETVDTYSDVLDTLTRDVGEQWDPSGDMSSEDRTALWLSADSFLCVDTALSTDGPFNPDADDTWCDLTSPDGFRVLVCISPRYTAPIGPRDAARIALDVAIETMGGDPSEWFVIGVSRVR